MALLIQNEAFSSEFDALISETMERWKTPGASIAVIRGSAVVAKGYGLSRFPDVAVQPETLFNCASMTKAFTAAAVSLLVDDEDGFPDVKFNTPVSNLIRDDFVLSESHYTEHVTLEDILSHRSGLPDHDNACFGPRAKAPDTPQSTIRKLRHLPLAEPPRTKFLYSNLMYTAAAHVVESLTGQWFGDFLSKRLWKPIGMNNTYYGMSDLIKRHGVQDMAQSYGWDAEEEKYFDIRWCDQPEGSGSGEMISNVLDYAAFLKVMIHKTGPISKVGHEELIKPRIWTEYAPRPFMSHQFYGLGWQIDTYHGHRVINHDGAVDGFSSTMMYLPDHDFGVVMFGNSVEAFNVHQKIAWALVDEVLDISQHMRYDWDAHLQEELELDKRSEASGETLFPNLPVLLVPMSLPLESYVGPYAHPGWGIMLVKLIEGELTIDCSDRSWPSTLTMEHVSGCSFLVKEYELDSRNRCLRRAQYRLSADGSGLEALGIDLVDDMKGEMIWFQKSAE